MLLLKSHILNKKVLLRECKRHTAHRAASARSAALSPDGWGGGELPPSSPDGGRVPHLVLTGLTSPDLEWGTPHPDLGRGYPSILTWKGGTPHWPDGGIPPVLTWEGGTSRQPDGGTSPPPEMWTGQTFPGINITFPRTSYTGGNKMHWKLTQFDWKQNQNKSHFRKPQLPLCGVVWGDSEDSSPGRTSCQWGWSPRRY